jgi:glyoxylase-like metal-dependent hydrolase (beta-lactamase superfamily II)
MTLDGTNTWVLRFEPAAPAIVIDPGPLHERHLRAVAAAGPIETVLITHRHPDHVEGLDHFLELTGARVATGDGEHAGLAVRALPTPGHTADSVCFEVTAGDERAVFTGDTILGRGTTVVAWPDGVLGDYLDSLERLTAYPFPALPGHGPALADCAAAARFYLAHRRARLDQVRAAVAAGAGTPAEVVDVVYRDVGADLRAAAEWSVRAQLAYLARELRRTSHGLDMP